MTQRDLNQLIKSAESADGTATRVKLNASTNVVIESIYIHGSGAHRAWKRLYYLEFDGIKIGGYDRRDSFISWATTKLAQRDYAVSSSNRGQDPRVVPDRQA